jgi:hypothetical protein
MLSSYFAEGLTFLIIELIAFAILILFGVLASQSSVWLGGSVALVCFVAFTFWYRKLRRRYFPRQRVHSVGDVSQSSLRVEAPPEGPRGDP